MTGLIERPLRILVIAPLRFPIRRPFAGGLESALWNRISLLRARGHQVTVCGVAGSDFMENSPPELVLPAVHWPDLEHATDSTFPPGHLQRAFAALERALAWVAARSHRFDVVDNHCLHGVPLAWADRLGVPMVTTLHTPVLPDMVHGHRQATEGSSFVAVGEHTARDWAQVGVHARVVPNAVHPDQWPLGRGGEDLVWFGRIVAEKAPHLAVEAARAMGRRIVLAGRIGDEPYARRHLWPLLGADAVHVGPLAGADLAQLVGGSACTLVTPVWEEPFGLVIAESLMCGTPVVAFAQGGIPQVVAGHAGARLVVPEDVTGMARAATELIDLVNTTPGARAHLRNQAIAAFSLDARINRIVRSFRRLIGDGSRTGAVR